ncbi:hypothetical protein GCM10027168_44900 [Streptomyces capparidis]
MPVPAEPSTTPPLDLSLPDTFVAFYVLYHRHYLEYARLRLGSHEAAVQTLRETFGELALAWDYVLSTPSPSAHAWAVFTRHVRDRAHTPQRRRLFLRRPGRSAPPPSHSALCRRRDLDDDIDILRRLKHTDTQIAELTGMHVADVRAAPVRHQRRPHN